MFKLKAWNSCSTTCGDCILTRLNVTIQLLHMAVPIAQEATMSRHNV